MSKVDSRPAEEMSMEDILASIRKMIAQDQDVMDNARAEREASLPSEGPATDDEVLDLIDELPEDGVTVNEEASATESLSAWDAPPEESIAELRADAADEALDLDAEFAIEDGAPPPVETAAEPAPVEEVSWGPADAMAPVNEPIMVGLAITSDPAPVETSEPDMGDIPRFLDERQHNIAETEAPVFEAPTFDEPDDSVVEPETAAPAETAEDIAQTSHEEVASMDAPQDRILSPEAAVKTSAAFDQLAQTLISGYDGDTNTLEGVVRAMLKPLLKEWLDANLPSIVENIVQTEIRRLSR